MRTTTTTTTTPARSLGSLALESARDFALGGLPMLAALAGIAALVVLPLWWVARSLGVC